MISTYDHKNIMVAIRDDGDNELLLTLLKAMAKPPFECVTFKNESAEELIKLLGYRRGLKRFELVSHGSPTEVTPFNLRNIGLLSDGSIDAALSALRLFCQAAIAQIASVVPVSRLSSRIYADEK